MAWNGTQWHRKWARFGHFPYRQKRPQNFWTAEGLDCPPLHSDLSGSVSEFPQLLRSPHHKEERE